MHVCKSLICKFFIQGCQTTSGKDKFGLGLLSSVKFDLTGSANKWVLKATYTGGDGGRRMIVSFNFADKASPKTSFTNEQPELNYVSCIAIVCLNLFDSIVRQLYMVVVFQAFKS